MPPFRTSPAIRPGTRLSESLAIVQPERPAGRDVFARRIGNRGF